MQSNKSFVHIVAALVVGYSLSAILHHLREYWSRKKVIAQDLLALIGNTPLLRINSLSELTGSEILAKAEVDIFVDI